MKPKLSIVIPGIRTQNWVRVVQELKDSCNGVDHEIIFVGPISNPRIIDFKHVYFVKDFGSPVRCLQRGLLQSDGELFTWVCDDGEFSKGGLESCVEEMQDLNYKDALLTRYTENRHFRPLEYWYFKHHADLRFLNVPDNTPCFPMGMLYRHRALELGGFDCRYNHINMPCHDLGLRLLHNDGQIYISKQQIASYLWMEGKSGDHLPIHNTELDHDIPLFQQEYKDPSLKAALRKVELDNYEKSLAVWERFR